MCSHQQSGRANCLSSGRIASLVDAAHANCKNVYVYVTRYVYAYVCTYTYVRMLYVVYKQIDNHNKT